MPVTMLNRYVSVALHMPIASASIKNLNQIRVLAHSMHQDE
jgi:hypothetical protein